LASRAAANRFDGVGAGADGRHVLKVAVTAVPEAGKANRALVKLLAKEWQVAKSDLTIVSGATDRRKTLHLAGNAADVLDHFRKWADQRGFGEGEELGPSTV
jgi:uncharacterized protein (TIGR00251 family)